MNKDYEELLLRLSIVYYIPMEYTLVEKEAIGDDLVLLSVMTKSVDLDKILYDRHKKENSTLGKLLLYNTKNKNVTDLYDSIRVIKDGNIAICSNSGAWCILSLDDLKVQEEHKISNGTISIKMSPNKNDISIRSDNFSFLLNVHGDILDISNSDVYLPVNENMLMSRVDRKIYVFDNLVNKKLQRIIDLSALKSKVKYFPICFTGEEKESYKNYLFLYFNKTNNIYAYDWYTKNIYRVTNTAKLIDPDKLADVIKTCMNTSDEERLNICKDVSLSVQHTLEKRTFEEDKIRDFGLAKTIINGRKYLVCRSMTELADIYQRNYNDKVVNWNRDNMYGIFFEDDEIHSDRFLIDKLPYKIKMKQMIKDLMKSMTSEELGELKVTQSIVAVDELCKIENIRRKKN